MKDPNDFALWRRPSFDILCHEQLKRIYEAALEILERIGGDFHDEEAVALLGDSGAHVKNDRRVRIPSPLVEEALRSVPKRVVMSDRKGRRTMFLEGKNIYFGTGSDTPFTSDPYTGQRREAVKDDVERAARVVDFLSNIDFCMGFGIASDVHKMTSDCHHFEAMVRNTTKPLIVTSWHIGGLERIFDMMVAIKGSEEELRADPFVIVYLQAISPLTFPRESLQKLLFCAEKGIPVVWTGGCPTLGSTAPVTPAGAFAIGLAEVLAGLVLVQLKRRGAPMISGGGGFGSLDMATGLRPYCSPEQNIGHITEGEMNRYLGLPSWGVGGTSDAKVLDEQAVAEAYQKLFLASISGSNLIHDVGYLESGMTSSLELLTIADDFISHAKRFLRSFVVSRETLALDLIEEVGPGGNYLAHSHTLEHFKEEIWMPELIDRQDYANWFASGRKTLKERANEKVRWILENHEPEPLPAETEAYIRRAVEEHDRRCARPV